MSGPVQRIALVASSMLLGSCMSSVGTGGSSGDGFVPIASFSGGSAASAGFGFSAGSDRLDVVSQVGQGGAQLNSSASDDWVAITSGDSWLNRNDNNVPLHRLPLADIEPAKPQIAVNPLSELLPMPLATGRLTSGYGPRRGRHHNGVDWAAPEGTAVQAAADGVVEELRLSTSYGNYVRIRHADSLATAYAHLNTFAESLEKGSRVRRGQTIGSVGATGRASGNHLHYEVISKGEFIDPLSIAELREPALASTAATVVTSAAK